MNSAALPRLTTVLATLLLTVMAGTDAVADSARLGLPVMGTVLQVEVVAAVARPIQVIMIMLAWNFLRAKKLQ